ncbi:MAG: OmpA family protein [Pseudomonadota bacterium]
MPKLVAAMAVFLSAIALPAASSADGTTFNALFFRPATGRNPYLMLQGTETLHQLQFDVGEIVSYGYHPFNLQVGGTRVAGVIDQTLVADFVAAIGAMEWMQFGIDFPLILVNQFRYPYTTTLSPMANHFDIGDLRFEAKFRVLDSCKKTVGLALIPFVTVPTGNDAHFVGDPGLTGGIKVALDARVHRKLALTFNLGYKGGRKVSANNITFQNQMLIGGGVDGILMPNLDVFAEVNAMASFNKFFSSRDMNPAEMMVGARFDIKKTGVTIEGGGGTCLVCGAMGARARAVLGVKYRLNTPKYQQKDADVEMACIARLEKGLSADELKHLRDTCPSNPADYQAGVSDPGCLKYYDLRDITNLVLRCPSRLEDFDSRVHDAACPKVFNLAGNYTSGEIRNIYTLAAEQMSILCPPNPEDFNAQVNDIGCPKYYDLKEFVAMESRCPPSGQYQEGVDDASCPKFYELRDSFSAGELAALSQLSSGEFGEGDMLGGEIKTSRPVTFAFNSAKLRKDMTPTLDEVIGVVNGSTHIRRLRVGGHADALGTSQANELISLKRAQVVIDYMKAHGVRSDVDLVPVAYGANRPVAPNTTEAGRKQNRRAVVFVASGYNSFSRERAAAPVKAPPAPPIEEPAPPPPVVEPPPPVVEPPAEILATPPEEVIEKEKPPPPKPPERWGQ